jgi:homoserine kinase
MIYIKDKAQYEQMTRFIASQRYKLDFTVTNEQDKKDILASIERAEAIIDRITVEVDENSSALTKPTTIIEMIATIGEAAGKILAPVAVVVAAVVSANASMEVAKSRKEELRMVMNYEREHDDFIAGHEFDVINKIHK